MLNLDRPATLRELGNRSGWTSPETGHVLRDDTSRDADAEAVGKIKELPKEVGAMLLSVGVMGLVLPGIMGTPAFIAGGLVLWPSAFGKVEDWFERRYPDAHQRGMKQIGRFLKDMEQRFPDRPRE